MPLPARAQVRGQVPQTYGMGSHHGSFTRRERLLVRRQTTPHDQSFLALPRPPGRSQPEARGDLLIGPSSQRTRTALTCTFCWSLISGEIRAYTGVHLIGHEPVRVAYLRPLPDSRSGLRRIRGSAVVVESELVGQGFNGCLEATDQRGGAR